MVTCEWDDEVSGEVLGWKLPAWQALLLHRALPSCGGLLVYLTLMCFDIALIYEHYQTGKNGVALFCIILMVAPAVLTLMFTLASPPPGLRLEESSHHVEVQKGDARWLAIQFANCIFFPVAAIGRYCHQIFWSIEAVFASRCGDETRTRDAMMRVRTPSPLELYLFLQAFIHAAPHAVVNILEIIYSSNSRDFTFEKMSVQAVSIVASSLRMASTATIYRRFEREKLSGRKYPWSMNAALIDNATNETIEKNISKHEENIYESVLRRNSRASQNSNIDRNVNSNLIQFSPTTVPKEPTFYSSGSESGSDYLKPIPHENPKTEFDSDEEYVKPLTIFDRVAPRRSTQYTIENVYVPPPPTSPPPRPGSLAVWAEKMVENVESIPDWLSAPHRRRQFEVVVAEPDIPRAIPRKYTRGLEPQDATAAIVNFLGWYMFFVARLLSLAAFINFSPVAAIVVLIAHYKILLLLLIVPQASTLRRSFYLFLAFIYLFCLMEFKVRFRHVRAWHVFWIISCSMETVLFTGLWASIGNTLSSWWRDYVVLVIIGSTLLSYMCMLVYFVILKPRETIVYIDEKKKTLNQ